VNTVCRSAIIFFILTCFFSCKKENSEKDIIENRLSNSASPYLKEHADNPVDWYEWSPKVLEKAEKENKPIIISIGYSACHWCHVMEEESFMDSTVAAIMNKNFISIKIDREQRPDIDNIYMQAAELLNGSGGWPLNVFTLPNGKPFYAGTYFSRDEWKKVLTQISKTYKEDKSDLISTANALTKGIRKANQLDSLELKNSPFSEEDYSNLIDNWKKNWDLKRGGYKGNEKFPLPVSWNALLEYYYITGNPEALSMVESTLNEMAYGGIYDQLGGGFSRYTVDSRWRVPHFEKMLYDNALLISLYSNYFKVSENPEYKKVVEQSLSFIEEELSNGNGGYYSSINADSEGEEGKYYAWTLAEIRQILSKEEMQIFSDFYSVEGYGNWEEGKNVLYRNQSLKDFAKEKNLPYSEMQKIVEGAEMKLLQERKKRKKPTIDDKILTSWNALMMQAYLDAYTAFGKPDYLQKAIATGKFLKDKMLDSNFHLKRSADGETDNISGFAEDYAYLAQAYLDLYQISFNKQWLTLSEHLMEYTIENFRDKETGLFYFNSKEQKDLIVNRIDVTDDVLPSSNSVIANNLFVIGTLTENERFLELSEKMLQIIWPQIVEAPASYTNWTRLIGLKSFGIYEVAIMGEDAQLKNREMQAQYLPTTIFMGGNSENLPLLEAKLVEGKTYIYVCQNKSCKYPVLEVNEALHILNGTNETPTGFFDI